MLGEVDGGFAVAMDTLDLFRPSVGAFGSGWRRRRSTRPSRYTSEREAFGRPLAHFQAVGHQLAEVATQIQAARLLVRDAASQYDAGVRPVRKASAMAKLFATETAQRAVDVAIQVHGARALEKGHLLEHLYREVRAPRIYEGASEVQREIIARELFKEARVSQDKSLTTRRTSRSRRSSAPSARRSDEHDEILFIVVHQVYELWFKQLIHELRYLQRMLEEGNDARAFATFKRVLTILKLVVAQLDVIETMTPVQFLDVPRPARVGVGLPVRPVP